MDNKEVKANLSEPLDPGYVDYIDGPDPEERIIAEHTDPIEADKVRKALLESNRIINFSKTKF